MPSMDGFEFLRTYERQLTPHVRIVILSEEEDIQTRTLPFFVVDVLPQPVVQTGGKVCTVRLNVAIRHEIPRFGKFSPDRDIILVDTSDG